MSLTFTCIGGGRSSVWCAVGNGETWVELADMLCAARARLAGVSVQEMRHGRRLLQMAPWPSLKAALDKRDVPLYEEIVSRARQTVCA